MVRTKNLAKNLAEVNPKTNRSYVPFWLPHLHVSEATHPARGDKEEEETPLEKQVHVESDPVNRTPQKKRKNKRRHRESKSTLLLRQEKMGNTRYHRKSNSTHLIRQEKMGNTRRHQWRKSTLLWQEKMGKTKHHLKVYKIQKQNCGQCRCWYGKYTLYNSSGIRVGFEFDPGPLNMSFLFDPSLRSTFLVWSCALIDLGELPAFLDPRDFFLRGDIEKCFKISSGVQSNFCSNGQKSGSTTIFLFESPASKDDFGVVLVRSDGTTVALTGEKDFSGSTEKLTFFSSELTTLSEPDVFSHDFRGQVLLLLSGDGFAEPIPRDFPTELQIFPSF